MLFSFKKQSVFFSNMIVLLKYILQQRRIHFPLDQQQACCCSQFALHSAAACYIQVKAIWLGRNIKTQMDSCSGGENYCHFKCHSVWCMIKGTMRYLLSRQGTDAKGEICSSSLAHCLQGCLSPCQLPSPTYPRSLKHFAPITDVTCRFWDMNSINNFIFSSWKIWLKCFTDK